MENIIATLFNAQIESFAREFVDTSRNVFYDESNKRLIHSGEFGMLREASVRNFLSNFLPDIYGISQGYVITQKGDISHQCDIIIYHKSYTPYFHTPEQQRFFPIESVIAVGEVKSKIDGTVLEDAISKLTKIKQLKETITSASIAYTRTPNKLFDPINNLSDQLVTFLIGEEFTCTNPTLSAYLKKSWNDSSPRHRVNLVTAVSSGTCLYEAEDGRTMIIYPVSANKTELLQYVARPNPDTHSHLAVFMRFLLLAISQCTVVYPELTHHFESIMKCDNFEKL